MQTHETPDCWGVAKNRSCKFSFKSNIFQPVFTYSTPCVSVLIVNFEQVIAGWDCHRSPEKVS